MLYELVEWAAAVVFGGDLGMAFLGTQGDVWDAHKDMALASLGELIAMLVIAIVNRRRHVSDPDPDAPLGEVALARPKQD